MKFLSKAAAGVSALLVSGAVVAFPPAPHHTLYGMVRNQWGDPVSIFPSDVHLETPSGSRLRTSLAGSIEPGGSGHRAGGAVYAQPAGVVQQQAEPVSQAAA